MYICFFIFFYTYVYIFLIYTIYFNTRVLYLYLTQTHFLLFERNICASLWGKMASNSFIEDYRGEYFYGEKFVEHLISFRKKWSQFINFQFSNGYNLQRDLIHFYKHSLVLRIINACTLSTWLVFRCSFTRDNLRQNFYKYHDQCSIDHAVTNIKFLLKFWQSKNII